MERSRMSILLKADVVSNRIANSEPDFRHGFRVLLVGYFNGCTDQKVSILDGFVGYGAGN